MFLRCCCLRGSMWTCTPNVSKQKSYDLSNNSAPKISTYSSAHLERILSGSPENKGRLVEELQRDDDIVLTYACDRPETLDRLSTYWLPELRRLEVKVPVIVVGCMLDKREDQQPASLEQVMTPIDWIGVCTVVLLTFLISIWIGYLHSKMVAR